MGDVVDEDVPELDGPTIESASVEDTGDQDNHAVNLSFAYIRHVRQATIPSVQSDGSIPKHIDVRSSEK
jgi:hypothetical protein